MRRCWRELRIGVVAGIIASALLLVVQQASHRFSAAGSIDNHADGQWIPPLVDPVASAQSALERGDSALVAIQVADSLMFPAVTSKHRRSDSTEPFRLYSPASTGLSGEAWVSFMNRAMTYAAAYNAVVLVARGGGARRT